MTGGGDRDITSDNTQFGIYIQDDWEVNEHLLLNLGVRWDYEQTPGYYDYETPAALASGLRGWANIQRPAWTTTSRTTSATATTAMLSRAPGRRGLASPTISTPTSAT